MFVCVVYGGYEEVWVEMAAAPRKRSCDMCCGDAGRCACFGMSLDARERRVFWDAAECRTILRRSQRTKLLATTPADTERGALPNIGVVPMRL
jgi:hypothetical protein